MKRSPILLATTFALAALGCSETAATPLYDQERETLSHAVETYCECYATLEYASAAECVAETDRPSTYNDNQAGCLEAVYDANEEELRAAKECQIAAFEAAHDCLHDVVACDGAAITACTDAAELANEACPEVPANIQALIEACVQETPVATAR